MLFLLFIWEKPYYVPAAGHVLMLTGCWQHIYHAGIRKMTEPEKIKGLQVSDLSTDWRLRITDHWIPVQLKSYHLKAFFIFHECVKVFVKVRWWAYTETWSTWVTCDEETDPGGGLWISIFSGASPGLPISSTSSGDWIALTQLDHLPSISSSHSAPLIKLMFWAAGI